MRNTILIIALVIIAQSDYLLVHANASQNNQNGNTFFGFQFQPFQAKFEGHASYNHKEPEITSTTTAAYSYYETIGARSNFNLFNIGQAIKEGIEQIFQTIARDVEEKIANAKNYAKVLGDHLKALIENYQYIRLRGSFAALKTTLESVSQYADILKATSDKLQQNLAEQVTNVDNNLMSDAASWSSIVLERLDERTDNNEWAQNQAQEKINEIINRYGAYQESCKDEAYSDLKAYEENILAAVDKIEILQDKSLKIIQKCIDSYSNPIQCVRDINNLIRDLRLRIYDLRNLNVEGIRLNSPLNSYARRSCVIQTSQEFQLERLSIEIQIESIRLQAPNHPNVAQSTENPSSSSEATTQSTGSGSEPTTQSTASGGKVTTESPGSSSEGTTQSTGSGGKVTTENPASDGEETTEDTGSGDEGTTENPNHAITETISA